MAATAGCTFMKRIAAFLVASAIFLALGPPTPALAQCTPVEQAKLLASDAAATDWLGICVAASGDTAVVGAERDDNAGGTDAGAAYVYVRNGGVWTQQAKLVASDAAANDDFGYSVSISGDTALVGAYSDDNAGGSNAGAAYVFIRTGTVWTQQAKLIASDAAAQDGFGWSVALSGNTAVIGSDGDAPAGSAYVFVRAGTVWTQQAKLTASDAAADDSFGYSVAVLNDTVVVGATSDDQPGAIDAGSAYVFVRSGVTWTQQAKLLASDPGAGDYFGISVGISGESVIVGAWNNAHDGVNFAGAAYVFTRAGTVWGQQGKLTASDPSTIDLLGTSVAISGDIALAGAIDDDNAGGVDAGSVYVFVRSGGVWAQAGRLNGSDTAASDSFGISVALSGETAVIGAYRDDNVGGSDAGSAYVITLGLDCDGDGVPNVFDACPNNTPGLPVCTNGRPLRDCNNDCVVDGLDVQCIANEMLGQ